MAPMERPLIFVSYSRANEADKEQLLRHLRVLDAVDVWSDARIAAGQNWRSEIDAALSQARAAILLITVEFLNSAFIREAELPALLKAHASHDLTIFPLIARPCAWQNVAWLTEMQVRPRDGKPIWRGGGAVDQRLAEITTEIGEMLKKPATAKPAPPPPPRSNIPHIFAKSDSAEFVVLAEALLKHAKRIVLIGTGLNLLHREPVFLALADRAARGECSVEVYMADPWSPDVGTRLIEEELGDLKPPVGSRGLIQRLSTILDTLERRGSPAAFSLKLFSHYPTFAMCVIDDDYFFYPYGYARLGNFSPVAHYSRNDPVDAPMIEFLDDHYARVSRDAVDARRVFDAREGRAAAEELRSFAVYFVPPAGSPLYQFGSNVMAWSMRTGSEIASPFSEQAGSARHFGFHLTIADALHFTSDAEVSRVKKEIELLLATFSRFPLTNFRLETFPDDGKSISILCDDPTRSLEALHFELVSIVYRRAIGSNYTLGLTGRRDPREPGDNLMLQRYHAPYILNHYHPHFTLLTDAKLPGLTFDLIQGKFETMVPKNIEVTSIAFMSQPSPDAPWRIEKEIPLR